MGNSSPVEHGPERRAGQGLDRNQFESGDRTILALLKDTRAADETDLVATFRDDAYEVWSRRGMVRFKRYAQAGGPLQFRVVEQVGENPITNQDPFAIASIDQELEASGRSGNSSNDPNRAFFEPQVVSHPYAYERLAQVFDSPRGPDLIVSPKAYAFGIQPGQHGALDVVQSRAPLIFAGRGVSGGHYQLPARQIDIAPTIARIMHFPEFDGRGVAGEPARVMLKRQDGVALMDIVDRNAPTPDLVYLILLDGLSHSELVWQVQNNRGAIPAIASLVERGAFLSYGSIVNFPSITWPSHSTIMTGTWCGHHDIVNPAFHLREHRLTVPIQSNIFEMEHHLNPDVETLYEAFKRALGSDAITASIHEPQSRGADHAVFERRLVGDKARLKALTEKMLAEVSPRWMADNLPGMHREEIVDVRGMAQVLNLFEHCGANHPVFVAHEFVLTDGAGHDYGPHHEGLREAIYLTDRRIGRIFAMLRERGLFDSTLFVLTSDHGMAAQRIEMKANPAREPGEAGIKGVFVEPMIYLSDLAVGCERTRDLRSLRVSVTDNDRLPDGVRPPVAGARVTVLTPGKRTIGEAVTTQSGSVAFATPANLSDSELTVRIEHAHFNPRTVTGDGTPIRPDLKRLLYGEP